MIVEVVSILWGATLPLTRRVKTPQRCCDARVFAGYWMDRFGMSTSDRTAQVEQFEDEVREAELWRSGRVQRSDSGYTPQRILTMELPGRRRRERARRRFENVCWWLTAKDARMEADDPLKGAAERRSPVLPSVPCKSSHLRFQPF